MPSFNFTFQEASPVITYSPHWAEDNPNDTFAAQYNGTFRQTDFNGGRGMISFLGTGISIFGSKRSDHGDYLVRLDNFPLAPMNGFSSPDMFNQILYSITDLPYANHNITIRNTEKGKLMDIDYVSIERRIGEPNDTVFHSTVDDSSPTIRYSPPGTWFASTQESTAFNGTQHGTTYAGAQVSITFEGCCIEIYGAYANANFTVLVDDKLSLARTGLDLDLKDLQEHPQTLLSLIDGLDEDQHTVVLTKIDMSVQRPLFFDYAVVHSTRKVASNNSKNTAGVIIGAVLGALVLAGLVAATLFIWLRRRNFLLKKTKAEGQLNQDLTPSHIENLYDVNSLSIPQTIPVRFHGGKSRTYEYVPRYSHESSYETLSRSRMTNTEFANRGSMFSHNSRVNSIIEVNALLHIIPKHSGCANHIFSMLIPMLLIINFFGSYSMGF